MNEEYTQEEQVVETQELPEQEVVEQAAPPVSNHAEQNWRQVRQELEQMRLEKMRLEEQLRAQQKPQEVEEEDLGDPSDLVTKAELKKYAEKLARKQVEKLLQEREQLQREQEKNSAPARLKQKFSDFDQVVTQEALERFTQQDPELAESLGMLASDPYKQGIAVYKALKAMQPQKVHAMPEKKTERPPISSSAAPKSSSALSNANLFANGLTPELKAQLYKEMEESARRY